MKLETTLNPLALSMIVGKILLYGVNLWAQSPATSRFVVPKMWDDVAMSTLEVPTADPVAAPTHAPASYYYRIPVRPIYKRYPIYAPGREPAGYMEWLKKQEPVVLWDSGKRRPVLKTRADWTKAGEIVFDEPVAITEEQGIFTLSDVRNIAWYEKSRMPLTPDGKLPLLSYVIREKGKIELGSFSCGMCHTRVMPDRSVLKGAQGNMPFGAAVAQSPQIPQPIYRVLFGVPWLKPDPIDRLFAMENAQISDIWASAPAGVIARHQASPFDPVQVPDLIGVKDRHYLDRTGLQQNRTLEDLMRYAALNQGADFLSSFNGFVPADVPAFKNLPDPSDPVRVGGRYSDEQLYALALYVYSLKPPRNPNRFGPEAARGKEIFVRQGCPVCHTPPLYTNNKLTPATGFSVPVENREKYDILPISVDTDPRLTLTTRRGTGYYKVPSLKGVWYRNMFGHSGWCADLEDWFDPKRTLSDYVPTGFKPFDKKTYAVTGHPFGLDLSEQDRKALIVFLKTL
jgi:hypothetical protein